jgi:hypothetical protein
MNHFLSRMVSLIRCLLRSERNYGCLPEGTGEPRPADKIQTADPSLPKIANPVEKDRSLL